jgi:hypothetical protein
MDDAIRRECFKEDKPVSGKRKRKVIVALSFEHGLRGKEQVVLHCMGAAGEKLAWGNHFLSS